MSVTSTLDAESVFIIVEVIELISLNASVVVNFVTSDDGVGWLVLFTSTFELDNCDSSTVENVVLDISLLCLRCAARVVAILSVSELYSGVKVISM